MLKSDLDHLKLIKLMLLKSEIKTVQQLNIYQKLKRSTIYRWNYIWNSKFKPPNQWNEMWNWKLRVGSIKQPRNEHPLVGMFCSSLVPLTDPVIVTATKNHRAEPCHNPTTSYHTLYRKATTPYHTPHHTLCPYHTIPHTVLNTVPSCWWERLWEIISRLANSLKYVLKLEV